MFQFRISNFGFRVFGLLDLAALILGIIPTARQNADPNAKNQEPNSRKDNLGFWFLVLEIYFPAAVQSGKRRAHREEESGGKANRFYLLCYRLERR
jgi:hypothetical protein